MRICLTYDLDHLSFREHIIDPTFFAYLVETLLDLIRGKISLTEFLQALRITYGSIFSGKDPWDRLDRIVSVHKKRGFKGTFFFAVKRARCISYECSCVQRALHKLKGFEIGLHCQDISRRGIIEEAGLLSRIASRSILIARSHYLRTCRSFHDNLKAAGIKIDSTEGYSSKIDNEIRQPSRTSGIHEIPFHIMDIALLSPLKMNRSLSEAKRMTEALLDQARKQGKTLVILIHPHHYSESYPVYRRWIDWLYRKIERQKIRTAEIGELAG